MENNRAFKIIYTFFLGLFLVFFVGVGISTFYESPKAPDFPVELNTYGKTPTPEQTKKQQEFDNQTKKHDEAMRPYNRNTSVIALVSAVGLLALSLVFEKKMRIIADGIMLGGLFTLFYSLGNGLDAGYNKYSFLVVTVGLAAIMYLGYHRFVRHDLHLKSAKS